MDDTFDIIILYYYLKHRRIHSRYKKSFYKSLCAEEKRRRDRRIPRPGLQLPRLCSWQHLIQSENNQGLITLTGLDYPTLMDLNTLSILSTEDTLQSATAMENMSSSTQQKADPVYWHLVTVWV